MYVLVYMRYTHLEKLFQGELCVDVSKSTYVVSIALKIGLQEVVYLVATRYADFF
jgi:hypothetical protein